MKRFKNASNLSNINAGDNVSKETLSPRSIYSQTVPPLPPGSSYSPGGIVLPTPPTPPPPRFTGNRLDRKFKIKLQEALDIIDGKLQADEIKGIKQSGYIGALSAAVSTIPKLQMLGSGVAQVGSIIIATQVVAALLNRVKPILRAGVAKVIALPELKHIDTKEYDIEIFQMVDIGNNTKVPSGIPNIEQMTLRDIGDMLVDGATVKKDYILYNDEAYAFKNKTDVDNINEMFRKNDTSNKIDAAISYTLPWAGPVGELGYLWWKISASDADKKKAAEQEKSKKPGVYNNPTPQKKQQMDAAKQQYLDEQKKLYGPKS